MQVARCRTLKIRTGFIRKIIILGQDFCMRYSTAKYRAKSFCWWSRYSFSAILFHVPPLSSDYQILKTFLVYTCQVPLETEHLVKQNSLFHYLLYMWQKQQQWKEIKDVSTDSEAETGDSESSDINKKNVHRSFQGKIFSQWKTGQSRLTCCENTMSMTTILHSL